MSVKSVEKYNSRSVIDERLLIEKVYFLNRSQSKYVVIGISPTRGFNITIRICSTKSNQCVQFTEYEWQSFWEKESMIVSCFTFQTVYQDVLWELEKSYKFERVNNDVVLRITDVSYNSEVYLGRVSFWKLQEVKELINLYMEWLKISGIEKTYEELRTSIRTQTKVSSEVLKVLEGRKTYLSFLVYFALREYVLFYPSLVEKDLFTQSSKGISHPSALQNSSQSK